MTFPKPAVRRALIGWLLLAGLLGAAPVRAQEGVAELLGALKGRASAPASAASDAGTPPADPKLVQRATHETQKGDERILADITARLSRNPAFTNVRAAVHAGVAELTGHVADNDARQLAAKVVGAIGGVVAVENQLTLHTDFGARLAETGTVAKERLLRTVALVPLLLMAAAVVWLANLLGRWLAGHLHLVRLDSRNPYLGTLVRRAIRTGFVLAGLLVALDLLEATALVTAVLGSAGVVGIVLGFAFRDMAENYLSGILLSLRRPFEPGDHVRVDSYEGKVVSLSTRNTVMMTLDGNELRLPNATVFKGVLLNFTHNPRRRFTFQLGVGYGEDLRAAQDLGVATMAAMQGVLADPGPSASIDRVGDSAVTINYYAWVDQRQTDFFKARSEAIRLVKTALEEAGMDLPEPIYRVQLAVPEGAHDTAPLPAALAPAAAPPPEPPAAAPVDPQALARTQGDVSPNTELDAQIAQERARKADQDMLRAPSGRAD
ncbi:mechanosensitive ion channel family protein [Ottowia testudinis]|uniref:Small-conductance mechanosensitive channel n=1 Tax=Ottowia testudinis TaxID=2816950 RepID=A0A975CHF4_9BURK|nr:mechanosensitive ion channel family protein [Ottowia testudinis]QTD45876.1 mechanosensitive ion channel [Ottowia testudinis]